MSPSGLLPHNRAARTAAAAAAAANPLERTVSDPVMMAKHQQEQVSNAYIQR